MLPFVDDSYIKRAKLYELLILPTQHDNEACTIFNIVLPGIAKLVKKMFHDHLPGGKNEQPSQEQIEVKNRIAKHNKVSES